MPFVSQAQRRWMHANEPEMAKRWEEHTPKGRKLPERKEDVKEHPHHSMGMCHGYSGDEETGDNAHEFKGHGVSSPSDAAHHARKMTAIAHQRGGKTNHMRAARAHRKAASAYAKSGFHSSARASMDAASYHSGKARSK